MPTAATGTGAQAPAQKKATMPMSSVPFIRASSPHREPFGIDETRTLGTSTQDLGVHDVSAYGYLRSIVFHVEVTGGAGASTLRPDFPFNLLKDIALTEPNGAVLSHFNTGYDLYLANKYGGYRNVVGSDAKRLPSYSATATGGNAKFIIRIPVELNARDGLGSLPNQNAAATFKLRFSLASATEAYSSVPATTLPQVRVRAYMEAWDQPEGTTAGQSNQTTPPAVNTTQFWSAQQHNVSAGQQTIRLTRVGNYIRNLAFVFRGTNGARATFGSAWPEQATLNLDTRPMDIVPEALWIDQMAERTGYTGTVDGAGGLDNGVYLYDFTNEFDGTLGGENRDLWLPTLGSTRLELQGNFKQAGTLTVLTNDVAIAGTVFM